MASDDDALPPWQNSLSFTLWRAQVAVHRRLQESLGDLGVTMTQLGLAVHLHEIGPLSASDLSRGYRITPQSVTTNLAQLERIGWISRRPHPTHGRVVLNQLTTAGVDGVLIGRDRVLRITREIEGLLPPGKSPEIISALRGIFVALDGGDTPTGLLWPIPER